MKEVGSYGNIYDMKFSIKINKNCVRVESLSMIKKRYIDKYQINVPLSQNKLILDFSHSFNLK